jgi:hypothetical protein
VIYTKIVGLHRCMIRQFNLTSNNLSTQGAWETCPKIPKECVYNVYNNNSLSWLNYSISIGVSWLKKSIFLCFGLGSSLTLLGRTFASLTCTSVWRGRFNCITHMNLYKIGKSYGIKSFINQSSIDDFDENSLFSEIWQRITCWRTYFTK